jgi:EAL domain-containing protein (putative c-di-GMP-specific phosphodiesterase class I)
VTAEPIPTFHERLPDLEKELAERGSLGVLVLDASALGQVEDQYGADVSGGIRDRIFKLLAEQQGKDYRVGDVLTLDQPRGLRFLFFLERKRRRNVAFSAADLRAARARLVDSLVPNIGRAGFPYFKEPERLEIGYAVALYNPLVHPERALRRAVDMALEQAAHQRKSESLLVRERLQDIILRERVVTQYQPIFRMKEEKVMAYEALSRGARGTGLETADQLFEAAQEHNLLVELDRLCRRRALLSSTGRVPKSAKIFVNTLPATIRDPEFRGKPLIDFLGKADVKPDRIVIEITEGLVIDNFEMFRDTMGYFTDLNMAFAVDDVGTGYSGLEAIAKLKPAFLKIDIQLIHGVHENKVNQAMVNAIISVGHTIGAGVIAEGIETEREAQKLREMGVDYGQGYHLGRGEPPPE